MIKALLATVLSLAVLTLPTASAADYRRYGDADFNGAEPDWRGLLQHGGRTDGGRYDGGRYDGGLGPLTAPPVIVAPRYDQRPRTGTQRTLPAQCLVRVDTRYGLRDVYDADCLRQQGYAPGY